MSNFVAVKPAAQPGSDEGRGRALNAASSSLQDASPWNNATLSVIIRSHAPERLPMLEEAIFSLALQDWRDLELVIALQNAGEEFAEAVERLMHRQPWATMPKYQIVALHVPAGVDARSALMNLGIEQAAGRYLAFLDDDDVVYQHGYTTLIQQLREGGRAFAVGGCRRARLQPEAGDWYVRNKDNPWVWGQSRVDLFFDNFVPIHSYVIDRSRTGDFPLAFDETTSFLEDYHFLLQLCASFEPDLSRRDVPVCEYRIRLDGSNTVLESDPTPSEAKVERTRRAQQKLREKKDRLICRMNVTELAEAGRQHAHARWELEHLRTRHRHLTHDRDRLEAERHRLERERDFYQREFHRLRLQVERLAAEYARLTHRLARRASALVRAIPGLRPLLAAAITGLWRCRRSFGPAGPGKEAS